MRICMKSSPTEIVNRNRKRQHPVRFVLASPAANSFFNSKGLSRFIPAAYACLAHNTCKRLRVSTMEINNEPKMFEFSRNSWTFHSKGMWIYRNDSYQEPSQMTPSSTIVGSSNFGERGLHRDLELSFVLTTKDAKLRDSFQREVDILLSRCNPVAIQNFRQRFPLWIRTVLVTLGIKRFL